jgi:hypothetical protein
MARPGIDAGGKQYVERFMIWFWLGAFGLVSCLFPLEGPFVGTPSTRSRPKGGKK